MNKTILAALALGSLMIVPGFAGAVHGSPYTANGIAIGPDGVMYNFRVHWTGYWNTNGEPLYSYVITLSDTNGVVISQETFPGVETWQGPVVSNIEFFVYHGWAQPGGSAHFDIQGLQVINISTGLLTMEYVGNWYNYQLELIVN
jgi:hypothetical protein